MYSLLSVFHDIITEVYNIIRNSLEDVTAELNVAILKLVPLSESTISNPTSTSSNQENTLPIPNVTKIKITGSKKVVKM